MTSFQRGIGFPQFFDDAKRPGAPSSDLFVFHRILGRGIYAMDIDNIEIGKGDRGVLYAADYKGPRESAEPSWHLMKVVDVFTAAGVPFFIIKWERVPEWKFTFVPLNVPAEQALEGAESLAYDSIGYAKLMFHIRGMEMPPDVAVRVREWEAGRRHFGQGLTDSD